MVASTRRSIRGLGVSRYAPTRDGFVIGHDGQNHPAINTTARLDPATGNGVVVLTTGSATLARQIGGEWTFWQTGKVGLDRLMLFDAPLILLVWSAGMIVIVVLITSAMIIRRRRPCGT
ncbi:MAG: hypothetical protein M0D54_04565 [Hyphomonadaceae bacterium JAD_PAG50586_4]|nr:MAG: hypothetical protein M0D54_04565 [Hyphomonadaceae bacterium JAD_PAG50586_4]